MKGFVLIVVLLFPRSYSTWNGHQVIYAAVRDEDAAELTEKLVDEPKLEKRRWAYALKDTSNKNTRKVSWSLSFGVV